MRHARVDYEHIQDSSGIIPEDEPVFLLRAKDKCAPAAIEAWANLVELMGGQAFIVQRAREWADVMRHWQTKNFSHVPDMPEGE